MPRKRKATAKKCRSQNREQYAKRSSNQDLSVKRHLKAKAAKADYYANRDKSLAKSNDTMIKIHKKEGSISKNTMLLMLQKESMSSKNTMPFMLQKERRSLKHTMPLMLKRESKSLKHIMPLMLKIDSNILLNIMHPIVNKLKIHVESIMLPMQK